MEIIDRAIIEFANEALYLAFNSRDLEQMENLWAKEHACVCIHPGWKPLIGREEILASWEGIFSAQGSNDKIVCYEPRILECGNTHTVVCYEQLGEGWLVATNSFVMEQGVARIFFHQAGQCVEPPEIGESIPVLQ